MYCKSYIPGIIKIILAWRHNEKQKGPKSKRIKQRYLMSYSIERIVQLWDGVDYINTVNEKLL
jgi:hypothetical protein